MAEDYEFKMRPDRMTTPSQNKREWLVGFEGVHVRFMTDPAEIAFAAREATWGDPYSTKPTEEQLRETLDEIASGKTLGSAKEVPALGWVVQCSRSSMDQTLRLREAAAGAQTTRDNDMRDFNIIVPESIEKLKDKPEGWEIHDEVVNLIDRMHNVYGQLIDSGLVPPQDARYVALPLGFQTHYVHIMNFRAFEKMCEQRLCNSQTQHETNYLTRLMRDAIVKEFPWTSKMFRSRCEKNDCCTKGTMLFPACGAFKGKMVNLGKANAAEVLDIDPPKAVFEGEQAAEFNPEKHLYPPELNDGQIMAEWDKDRKILERENPGKVYSMAGSPNEITEW